MAIGLEQQRAEGRQPDTGIIDCDVHPTIVGNLTAILPYMAREWRERVQHYGSLPGILVYAHPGGGVVRHDASPPGGGPSGSDPQFMAQDLLDRHGIARAILMSVEAAFVAAIPNPDDAAAIVAAYNDFAADLWLAADPRYRLAMCVAPQDTSLAAKEIERFGQRAGVAGVLLPPLDLPLGNRHYFPVYAAAERLGLPIVLHPAGTWAGTTVGGPQTAGGRPGSYFERHTSISQIYQANLISLVSEGVFERFPKLRVVMVEGGFAWVPHVMWRADKNWMGLRREVPWVKRPPSEYIVEHVRFTTQPMEEPKRPEHLLQIIDMMEGARTLLFATDYPHWDNDMPDFALRGLAEGLRRRILFENAREAFGARLD